MAKISSEAINIGQIKIPEGLIRAGDEGGPKAGRYAARLEKMFKAAGILNFTFVLRRPGLRARLEEIAGKGELETVTLTQSQTGQVKFEPPERFWEAADEFYRRLKAPEQKQDSIGIDVGHVTIKLGIFSPELLDERLIDKKCQARVRRGQFPIGGKPSLEMIVARKTNKNEPEQFATLWVDETLLRQIDRGKIEMNRHDRMKLEAVMEQLQSPGEKVR